MELYSFFNSSTSYRVRIALGLKGLAYEYRGVNIRKLEHRAADYVARNPSANVPLLVDGEVQLGQSLAIIDYLDATYPEPRLIPQDKMRRARVLEVALAIACDIHPVQNLKVLNRLKTLGLSQDQANAWPRDTIAEGLAACEALAAQCPGGPFCFGDRPGLADLCLVPQLYNARRFGVDLGGLPRLLAAEAACQALPAFQDAAPERQPDAE